MKIGLIGAQNSHSRHFCEVINKKRPWDDVTISYLYGEDDPAEAKRLCGDFGITACSDEDEVIQKSDAVIVTYRKGSAHYQPVMKALRAGKPVFNDKPFATDIGEAKEIIDLASERGIMLNGGSSLKGLSGLAAVKENITPGSTAVITFSADPESEYDGYWFYGCHAVEVCLTLFGLDYVSAQSFRNNNAVVTNVAYQDRLCVIATTPQLNKLAVSVSNSGKTVCYDIPMDYESAGPEEFVNMVKTGELPRSYEFYLKAVELTGKIIETAGL